MDILQSIILGLVQGLTEFLPVSSSGHLLLVQKLLGVEGDALFFDIILHVGTLLAVCIAFRKDIFDVLKKPLSTFSLKLVLATLVTVVIFFAFETFFRDSFSGDYLGWGFLITALLLFITDSISVSRTATAASAEQKKKSSVISSKERLKNNASNNSVNNAINIEYSTGEQNGKNSESTERGSEDGAHPEPTFLSAACIGLAQGMAVLPGISRSGSTICAALLSGTERKRAATFSFLLSIPIILGSLILESVGLVMEGGALQIDILPCIIGFVFAFLSGLASIKIMLKLIQKKRLIFFAVYLLLLGTFVVLNSYLLFWF